MNELIDETEMRGCSLAGQHSYEEVKDVIREACVHQRDKDLALFREEVEKLVRIDYGQYYSMCDATAAQLAHDKETLLKKLEGK